VVGTGIVLVTYGRIKTCYLCFTYTPVFTDSLVLGHRGGTDGVLVVEVTFHIPSIKCPSSTEILLLYRLPICNPYFPL